jgi:hypothetical protein
MVLMNTIGNFTMFAQSVASRRAGSYFHVHARVPMGFYLRGGLHVWMRQLQS